MRQKEETYRCAERRRREVLPEERLVKIRLRRNTPGRGKGSPKARLDAHHHFLSFSLFPTASQLGSAHENSLHTAIVIITLKLKFFPILLKNRWLPTAPQTKFRLLSNTA